jgi:hypothetical protein
MADSYEEWILEHMPGVHIKPSEASRAQSDANAQLNTIRQQEQTFQQSHSGQGYLPETVPPHMEHFEGISHRDIWNNSQLMMPAVLNKSADDLKKLVGEPVADAADTFRTRLGNILENGW